MSDKSIRDIILKSEVSGNLSSQQKLLIREYKRIHSQIDSLKNKLVNFKYVERPVILPSLRIRLYEKKIEKKIMRVEKRLDIIERAPELQSFIKNTRRCENGKSSDNAAKARLL